MSKQKFYVVWKGRTPGIYNNWADCDAQVSGFTNAKYKSYPTKEEADKAFLEGKEKKIVPIENKIARSISVDGACSVTTKVMEYQAVFTDTGEKVFHQGPFKDGTNNIGEFLALVHALAHCKKNGLSLPIYSDSKTAMAWVRDKKINSNIVETENNKELIGMVNRAIKWLADNTYTNQILKWETESWGENPADFGRK